MDKFIHKENCANYAAILLQFSVCAIASNNNKTDAFAHDAIVPYKLNEDGTATHYYPYFENGKEIESKTLAITQKGRRKVSEKILEKPWSYFCEGH